MNKKTLLFITLIISIFAFINPVHANFIHNGSLSLKLKSTGKSPTCTLTPNTLTSLNVTAQLSTTTNYTTEYRLTSTSSWDTYSSSTELIFNNNTSFEVRYKDSFGNYGPVGSCVIDNIDEEKPTLSVDPTSSTDYKQKVDGTITANDNKGLSVIKYAISESNTVEPTTGWISTSGENQTSKTIAVSDGTDSGTYYLWASATDIAGNTNTIVKGPYLLDNTAPTVEVENTSASDSNISIKVTSEDLHSGVKGYYYSVDNGVTYSTIQTSGFYMFAGLENNTTYKIKVKVEDNAGNTSISDPVSIKTAEFGNITVSVDSEGWATKKTATVSFENSSSYTYQFSTDGGNSWITITSTSNVTYNHNGVFMVKVTGNDEEEIYSYPVTHIDSIPVTINSISTPVADITEQSFKVVVDAIDTGFDEERSEIAGYKYSLDGTTWTQLLTSNEHTFYGLTADTEYTIYINAYDNAGNVTSSTATVTTSEVTDIFINGINGNDNNDGLSPLTAVKTFAKAKTLMKKGSILWICGQISITTDEVWDLNGLGVSGNQGVIKRWDGTSVPFTQAGNKIAFTTRAIFINPGIKLSLANLIIDGNKDNVVGTTGNSMFIQTAGDIDINNCIIKDIKSPTSGVFINSRYGTSYKPVISIKDSAITGNEGFGGSSNGIISYDKGEIIIDNTTFDNNINVKGGVIISAFKSGILDRKMLITNSAFTNNSGDKGGLSIDPYDNTIIKNTTFTNNTSQTNTIYLNNLSSITFENCTITDNAGGTGGGIYVTGADAVLNIKNTNISSNSATFRGGGIYLYNGTINIDSAEIKNNSASSLGSGIFWNAGTINIQGTINLLDNTDSDTKGDLYMTSGKVLNITGDLTSSNIGFISTANPSATSPIDIAIPATGYSMPNTYFNQFVSNKTTYETANALYDTTNNKVILKVK